MTAPATSTRCTASESGGYRCELPEGHDGRHFVDVGQLYRRWNDGDEPAPAPVARDGHTEFHGGPECERCGRREPWHPDGSCHVFHAKAPAPGSAADELVHRAVRDALEGFAALDDAIGELEALVAAPGPRLRRVLEASRELRHALDVLERNALGPSFGLPQTARRSGAPGLVGPLAGGCGHECGAECGEPAARRGAA